MDKIKAGFVYTLECVGADGKTKWVEEFHNLLPDVGRDYIMNAAMNGGSQYSTWYIGLYANQRTPVVGDTMTTLIADCGEISAYSGGARKELADDALSGGIFSNAGTPAEFTFTAQTTVRGGFISSGSVINNNSGLLLSAGLLPTAKTLEAGEILKVTIGWSMTAA